VAQSVRKACSCGKSGVRALDEGCLAHVSKRAQTCPDLGGRARIALRSCCQAALETRAQCIVGLHQTRLVLLLRLCSNLMTSFCPPSFHINLHSKVLKRSERNANWYFYFGFEILTWKQYVTPKRRQILPDFTASHPILHSDHRENHRCHIVSYRSLCFVVFVIGLCNNPTSYQMGIGGPFPGGKAAGA
jgi:hypothetical protein